MKEIIYSIIGVIGAAVAAIFGGWTGALSTLMFLMALDYITGLVVAGVFHNSQKTETGRLSSQYGWQGLAKKCMVLVFVFMAYRLDLLIGTTYLKDAVCIAYITNEAVSLIENAGLMGVPVPKPILNAVEVLKAKENDDE